MKDLPYLDNSEQQQKLSNYQYNDRYTPIKNTNSIVGAASNILLVMVEAVPINEQMLLALRKQVIHDIKKFEALLNDYEYEKKIILAARYCICTAFDEAILQLKSETSRLWAQKSLLSIFHNETTGGETFYKILDTLIHDPSKSIEVLELIFILLSLGFKGMLFDKSHQFINDMRKKLYKTINRHKNGTGYAMPHFNNHREIRQKIIRNNRKIEKTMAAFIIIISAIFYICNKKIEAQARPFNQAINHIALSSPITTYNLLTKLSKPARHENH